MSQSIVIFCKKKRVEKVILQGPLLNFGSVKLLYKMQEIGFQEVQEFNMGKLHFSF